MVGRASGHLAAAALTVLLAGCFGGGDEMPLQPADLAAMVLQLDDLTSEWQEFDRGSQARSDAFLGKPVDGRRFGRLGGWKARYRRPGPETPPGPLVIESKADLFESSAGALDELERIELLVRQSFPTAGIREEAGVGERALAATFVQRSGQFTTRFAVVAWRAENATATLFLTGVKGLSIADAVELARKQQLRIARLAGH
jgi:hypothetical protein